MNTTKLAALCRYLKSLDSVLKAIRERSICGGRLKAHVLLSHSGGNRFYA